MKHLFMVLILTCIVLTLLASGCGQAPVEPASKEIPLAPITEEDVPTEPSPLYTLGLSFPSGAPALNQVAELKVVATGVMNDVRIDVILPDGFELISGNLTWSADSLPPGDTEVINAHIKSQKTGNWTIEARVNYGQRIDLPEGGARYAIYVAVSEDSAEWREYPPYGQPSLTPMTPIRLDTASIPKVDLSVSHPPKMNEPTEVTCTLSSQIDMPNMNAQIRFYRGTLVGGSLEWQGDLKAGVPVTFSAQIVYKGTGVRHIGWYVSQVDTGIAWANPEQICLYIGEEQGSFCEQPTPVLPPPP